MADEYTPTLEDAKRTYAYIQGGLDHDEGYKPFYQVHEEAFDRMIAEVERAAAARALREFAQHLIESVMPEHGSHINMTPYREGLVDGVNRAVTAAGRRAAEIREGKNDGES